MEEACEINHKSVWEMVTDIPWYLLTRFARLIFADDIDHYMVSDEEIAFDYEEYLEF